jgi:ATP-dependent 26S proteasome regulatory subunit
MESIKYQPGFNFSDPIRDYEIIEFLPRHNMYLLKNFTDNRQDELMQESEIDYYISKKEQIEAKRAKNKIFLQKQEEQQRLEEEKERQEQERYNNVYGYCDNMTPMQTGKVLKVLNKKEIYYNNGVYVGSIARKEFIFDVLNNGGKIEL